MSPKYDILKFTESYRKAKHQHTILLPVAMVIVVLFSFWVVTKSRPGPASDQVEFSTIESLAGGREIGISAPPKIDLDFGLDFESDLRETIPVLDPGIELDPINAPDAIAPITDLPVAKVVIRASSDGLPIVEMEGTEGRFTPWMTQGELNQYIYSLNEGHEISFWDRGHWIIAVEGRWAGHQEFRIVYENNPDRAKHGWRYRIAQSRDIFSRNINELRKQGYKLVQSQAFEAPGGELLYQGVWQKIH